MKNLWNKLPAWLRAILLAVILMLPVLLINQNLIQLNMKVGAQFGWSLFAVVGVLAIYWFLVTRFNPFKSAGDIKLELKCDLSDPSIFLSVIGLVMLTVGLASIGFTISDVETPERAAFFEKFIELEPIVALPMLLALSIHAGLVEEVVFRGYMQNTTSKYPRFISYLFIGIVFACGHFLPWQLIVPYLLVSIGFSFVADKHKSIGVTIFAHALVDFIVFSLQYFEVVSVSALEGDKVLIVSVSAVLVAAGVAMLLAGKRAPKLALA